MVGHFAVESVGHFPVEWWVTLAWNNHTRRGKVDQITYELVWMSGLDPVNL